MPLLRMEKPNLKASQYRCVGHTPGLALPYATPRQQFCDSTGSSAGQARPWGLSWACSCVEAVQFVVFLSRQHLPHLPKLSKLQMAGLHCACVHACARACGVEPAVAIFSSLTGYLSVLLYVRQGLLHQV